MSQKAEGSLGFFERWLTLWVFLCMIIGIFLGKYIPTTIHTLGNIQDSIR